MNKIKTILFVLLCVTVFVGCCSACRQRQKNAKPLKGTEWHLVQFEGKDVELPINSFNLTLGQDGEVAGVGACNRLLGRYTTTENYAINLGQVGTTMMICPENEELERKFVQMLGVVTHYDIDGDKLILLQDGVIKALFKALPAESK